MTKICICICCGFHVPTNVPQKDIYKLNWKLISRADKDGCVKIFLLWIRTIKIQFNWTEKNDWTSSLCCFILRDVMLYGILCCHLQEADAQSCDFSLSSMNHQHRKSSTVRQQSVCEWSMFKFSNCFNVNFKKDVESPHGQIMALSVWLN